MRQRYVRPSADTVQLPRFGLISPVFASTRKSESYTRPLTVSDAGSFARNGANVFASANVPSMSRPPRTGDWSTSVGVSVAAGAEGWQATRTTTARTSPRAPFTSSV